MDQEPFDWCRVTHNGLLNSQDIRENSFSSSTTGDGDDEVREVKWPPSLQRVVDRRPDFIANGFNDVIEVCRLCYNARASKTDRKKSYLGGHTMIPIGHAPKMCFQAWILDQAKQKVFSEGL